MKKSATFVAVIALSTHAWAIDYYIKNAGVGAPTTLGNWGTNLDGSGSSPVSFSAANQLFNIQLGQSVTGGTWTVTGSGSKIVLGGSYAPTAAPSSATTIDLGSGASFTLNSVSYTNYTFGSVNTNSLLTVQGTTTLRDLNYVNTLVADYSANTTPGFDFNMSGTLSVKGTNTFRLANSTARSHSVGGLTVQSGASLNLAAGSVASTIGISSGLSNLGTIAKTGAGTATINFTGTGTSTATWGTVSAAAAVNVNSGRTVTFLDAFTSTGTLTLSNAGTLNIGNGGTTGSIQNTVNIANTGTLKFNRSNDYTYSGVISGSNGNVQQVGSAILTLSNANTYTGTTAIKSGTLSVTGSLADASTVSVEGGVYDVANSDTVGIVALKSGTISGSGTLTGMVYNVESGSISASLAGSAALNKTSSGTVLLSNTNAYSGATTITNGILALGHATNTLPDSNLVTVDGGTLALGSNNDTVHTFSLKSGLVTGTGTLTTTTFSLETGIVDAHLVGAGFLWKNTAGTVTVNKTMSYPSYTYIDTGTLALGHPTDTLPDTTDVFLPSGTLDLGSNSDTVARVYVYGGTITGNGSATLTATSHFELQAGSVEVRLSGIGIPLTKSTAGVATLSAANTYAGNTTISAGTLSLATTGSINNSPTIDVQSGAMFEVSTVAGGYTVVSGQTLKANGTVTGTVKVASGATLQGDGIISGNTTVLGNLSPGNSPGSLDIIGSLTLDNMANTAVTTMEIASASSYDEVLVSGGTVYDGILDISLTGSGYASGTQFDLFDSGTTPTNNFDFVNIAGSYGSGAFAFNSLLGTWTSTVGGTLFTFTNDTGVLSLTFSAVPEPLTAAGVILLAGRVLGRRSRVSL